jgi:4-amino-4-deoxy-L-arabinose transferase-like glycosyltransferase
MTTQLETLNSSPTISIPRTKTRLNITWQAALTAAALLGIVLLGAFLRFYELGAQGYGNTYYAATVKSMLTSWQNFFFASYEPGGSVSVDKPPLGFWIQSLSAYIFGVNGFALALPNALAGTLSIPLLFMMVKWHFGKWAGLSAALVLAVIPVTIVTERNNTIDGMLVFVLLLAGWAFLKSVESGKIHFLLLGAVLVGLGFNIKMLQAYMVLPAFYALYFLGAPHRWWKRLLHLSAATVLLLVISLSWAVAVDLTPASERPYVGSSEDNTVMELITGHNGIKRLIGGGMGDDQPDGGQNDATDGGPPAVALGGPVDGSQNFQGGPGVGAGANLPDGQNRPPPPQGARPDGPPDGPGGADGPGGGGGPGGASEVGEAGWLRLFTQPLVDEAGWLLPLALLGILLTGMALVLDRSDWTWPLNGRMLGLVLWAGWLLPIALYFTKTTGLFHAYYLIMLGPALAALVGAAVWALSAIWRRQRWLGVVVTAAVLAVSIGFQLFTLLNIENYGVWIAAAVVLASVPVVILLLASVFFRAAWLPRAVLSAMLLAAVVAPLLWAGLTTFNSNSHAALPNSGPASVQRAETMESTLTRNQQAILDYTLANTDPDDNLLAGMSSRSTAAYILETGRSALTFGGFNGGDDVISAEGLAQMVADGELRFILGENDLNRKPEISAWVTQNCTAVDVPGAVKTPAQQGGRGGGGASFVYDCAVSGSS